MPSFVCDSCRTVFVTPVRCKRKTCPECGARWVEREATRAAWYINANFRGGRIRRFIVSPGPGWVATDEGEVVEVRRRVAEWLKMEGWEGFYIVWHPYRDDESGAFTVEGGHFQGFGIKRKNHGVSAPPGGWVYKNLPLRGSLRKRIAYDLEHCGVVDGRHSVVWHGSLSYGRALAKLSSYRGDEPDRVEPENPSCPHCGGALRMLSWYEWNGCGGDMQRFFQVSLHDFCGGGGSGPPVTV